MNVIYNYSTINLIITINKTAIKIKYSPWYREQGSKPTLMTHSYVAYPENTFYILVTC